MKLSTRKIIFAVIVFTLGALYFANASWLVSSTPEDRIILAHRGLHQTYDPDGVKTMDCTARIIDTPIHDFIENTVASIEAAFELGADIVEIDIHPTTDGEFVVFHDWTLDCRTNGEGVVRRHDSTYLRSLDIGYGYTADGGDTFPFRGQFVGAMPTLNEVLTTFPDEKFLINIKGGNVEEAKLLTDYLLDNKNSNRSRLSVYGSGENIPEYAALNPDIITLHKNTAATCLKRYLLLGWSDYVPPECHKSFIPVPRNYQWLIWGWPNRFEERLKNVGSKPLLMGDHKKGSANSGIDDLESIPTDYGGIVFTNRIDIVGPNSADSISQ